MAHNEPPMKWPSSSFFGYRLGIVLTCSHLWMLKTLIYLFLLDAYFDLPIFLIYLFLLDAVLVNHGNLLNGLGNKSAD